MDIQDPYGADTLTAINDANQRPRAVPPTEVPGWSPWSSTKAIAKGLYSGAASSGGFWSDIIGAFGDVQAGFGAQADPALLVDPEARRKFAEQAQESQRRMQTGEAFSSPLGAELYGISKSVTPDAATSNIVDRTLFGFANTASRALGYSFATGPAIGATLTAADVGAEGAQRLKEQGVDIATRTGIGAIEGVGAGLGVVLPVAGKTIAQTAALVAAGGPGAYMAQSVAERAILRNAGYDRIADQYDPFDPVGLAVSTLVPTMFGALHMRSQRGVAPSTGAPPSAVVRTLTAMSGDELRALPYNDARLDDYARSVEQENGLPPGLIVALKNAGERSNSTQVSGAGARGVMQFIEPTWRAYGRGDPTNPLDSISAAGRYLPDLIRQYDGDVRAAVAAYNGGTKAGEAVHAGRAAPSAETRAYLNRVEQHLNDHAGAELSAARGPTPDEIDAARVAQNRAVLEDTGLGRPNDVQAMAENLAAFQRAQDQLGAGTRVDVTDLLRPEALDQARAMDDTLARLEDQYQELSAAAANAADRGEVAAMRAQLDRLESNPPNLADITESLRPRRTYEVTKTRASREAAQLERDARAEFEAQTTAQQEQITRLRAQIEQNAAADTARQQLQVIEPTLGNLRQQRAALDVPATRQTETAAAAARTFAQPETMLREGSGAPEAAALPTRPRTEAAPQAPRPASTEQPAAFGSQPDANAGESSTSAAGSAAPEQGAAARTAVDDMLEQFGDTPVMSIEGPDGQTTTLTAREALERVRAEAAQDMRDSPLLQAAANCFLRTQEL